MKTLNIYKSAIPSQVDNIYDEVNRVLENIRSFSGYINEDIVFEIKVVLNELLLNAVKHGNKNDKNKLVKIYADFHKNMYIRILVQDEGSGYNFNITFSTKKRIVDCDELCQMYENGRGILIVKGLCDIVKLNKKCNKILIKKKIF